MSAITVDDELVHYEVLGRGKPIILIHGWLGSWRYWVPTMQQLSTKYRCYALDLWGFGDSGKDPKRYTFEQQLELLDKFVDRMGMPKVVLVGHGLGAAVAARFAVKPETAHKVHRMLLIAPPLMDAAPSDNGTRALPANTAAETMPSRSQLLASLSEAQLQVLANSGIEPPKTKTMVDDQVVLTPTLKGVFSANSLDDLLRRATDSTAPDFEKLKAEVAKTDIVAVRTSADAFSIVSTFRDIMKAETPVFALLGENDTLLPRPEDSILQQLDTRSDLKLLVMSNTQHFPMLEDKAQFVRLLKDFLEAPNLAALELKEEWRRRKR
jgi:pimeloyl-ACP methyl ester carboxylesterase